MMSSDSTICNLLIAVFYGLLESRISKASVVCSIGVDSDSTFISMLIERRLGKYSLAQCEIVHKCDINIVWEMINKNSCSPNPEIGEKASHLRYQIWLSGDHLIDANTFTRSIITVLSNWTYFSFQALWFAMSHAKDARHANRKPVFELGKFPV